MPTTVPLYPFTFNARPPTPTARKRHNRRMVTVPASATPVVRLVFAEIARQQLRMEEMELSGVNRPTIKSWRHKNRPGLESLQAVLAFLGWDFCPVPCLETLPAELAADLVALARRAETTIPHVWRAALEAAVEQRVLSLNAEEKRTILAEHHARISNGHDGCKATRARGKQSAPTMQ